MLDASQRKMPNDLEELLRRLVDECSGGRQEEATVHSLMAAAGAQGYL
jgi:hypothetical protein